MLRTLKESVKGTTQWLLLAMHFREKWSNYDGIGLFANWYMAAWLAVLFPQILNIFDLCTKMIDAKIELTNALVP